MSASKCLGFALLLCGVLLFVLGIMMGPWLANTLDHAFKHAGEGVCEAEDLTEQSFLEPYSDCDGCSPRFFSYFAFDVNNVEEYLQDPANTKLVLQEMGPYVYRNFDVTVDAELEGDFVTYKTYRSWEFDADMSSGAESDLITKMDYAYLAVTTGTAGELNFIDSLLTSLMAMRGETVDVSLIPHVVKGNFMRLVNGLNSFDPATMLVAVGQLAPLFSADTDVDAYMGQLAAQTLEGIHFNGVFVTRTVRQFFLGYPSFTAGLAVGAQYPSCAAARETLGGQSMLEACDGCEGEGCHPFWRECAACRSARSVRAASDALCDALQAELESALGAAQAAAVTGATCRLCPSRSLFCLAPVSGEVGSLADVGEPADYSALHSYKVNQGCSEVAMKGAYAEYRSTTATALWQALAPGQEMPTVLDLGRFAAQSWCDGEVAEGVTCLPFVGNAGRVFEPAGVSLLGMASEVAFEAHDVFVTQAMMNITMKPTGEEVELKGLTLQRLAAPEDALDRVPWNEGSGVGFPRDGVVCIAFQMGFLAFVSRPMFLHGDPALREAVRMVTRGNEEVTGATGRGALREEYESFIDVHPGLGLAMEGRKRLMGSVALAREAAPGSEASTANLLHPAMPAHVVTPQFWVEERSTVTDDDAEALRGAARLSRAIAPVFGVGLGLGVLSIGAGIALLVRANQAAQDVGAASETAAMADAHAAGIGHAKARQLTEVQVPGAVPVGLQGNPMVAAQPVQMSAMPAAARPQWHVPDLLPVEGSLAGGPVSAVPMVYQPAFPQQQPAGTYDAPGYYPQMNTGVA